LIDRERHLGRCRIVGWTVVPIAASADQAVALIPKNDVTLQILPDLRD
jgi:hypothetical protein